MRPEEMNREELLNELARLRTRVAELETRVAQAGDAEQPGSGPLDSATDLASHYEDFFAHALNGKALHEIVTDEAGKPVDYVFLAVNPAFEELTGLTAQQVIKKRVTEVLPGIEETPFIEIYGRVALTGKGTRFEQYSAPLDRHYDIAAFSPAERLFGTVFTDITERVRAEQGLNIVNRALRTLSDCNQTIIRANSERDLLDGVCKAIVESGGYQLAWIGLAEQNEGKTVRAVAQAGVDDGYVASLDVTWADEERGRGPVGTAIRTGRTAIVRQVEADPDFSPWRRATRGRGYASIIALPICIDDEPIGALNVYAAGADAFGEEERQLLEELAADLAYGLTMQRLRVERRQHLAELREGRRQLRNLMAHLPGMAYRCLNDADWTMSFVSEGSLELTGYRPDELIDDRIASYNGLIHPDDREKVRELVQSGLERKNPYRAYYRITTAGGELKWVWEQGSGVYSPQGKLEALEGLVLDVTEQIHAEQELKSRHHALSTLYEASAAISSNLSLDQVLGTVAEQMANALGASGCTLSLWDRQHDSVETLVDYSTVRPDQTERSGTTYDLDDYPATRSVLMAGQWTVIQHDDPEADADERALLEQYKAFTLLMLPLKARDRVLGLVELISELERQEYQPEQIRLAESLVAQAAIAIANAQLYERAQQEIRERRQAEGNLQRRNRELVMLNGVITTAASTLDAEQVLQVACGELARTFDLPQATAALLNAEGTEATVVAEYLEPGRPSALGVTIPVGGNPATDYVLTHGEALAVTDALTDERLPAVQDLLKGRGIHSVLILPIRVARWRVAGIIGLDAAERREFSQEEIDLAQSVAVAAGQALELARLYRASRQQTERLQETVAQRTAELRFALDRAQSADRVKSEFVSNVSHELRSPLTNLKLYLNLLSRGPAEKREFYLATLNREANRLQDLIEGLLDISRLDLDETGVNLEATDLNYLVSTLALDRSELVADRELKLDVEQSEDLPPAMADAKLIQQVISNLLTNAINYSKPGGRITLRTALVEEGAESWATIGVRDTGPGIAEEERRSLFERFYRGEAGRKSGAPGTGLGLAICKEIMDRHDGRITVKSKVREGSEFTIWLRVDARD